MNCSVTCQSVQSQMADFSAGQLSPLQAQVFEEHCFSCPHCQYEWESFQSTLQLLCALPQALPCEKLSDEMWNCCCQDRFSRIEEQRHKAGPVMALRHCIHWINQQPRWAQGGWVASGVVVSGIALFWGSVWVVSPSSNGPVVASNIPTNIPTTPSASIPLTIDEPLPADGGPLRFIGRSQLSSSVAPYTSPITNSPQLTNTRQTLISSFSSQPMAALSGEYRSNRPVLPFERFMNHSGNHYFEVLSQAPLTPHSTDTPFVLEARAEEGEQHLFSSPPLLHGE